MPEDKKKFPKAGRDARRSAGKAFSQKSRPGGKTFPAGAKSRPPWLDREKADAGKSDRKSEGRPARRSDARPSSGQGRKPGDRPFKPRSFEGKHQEGPPRDRSESRAPRARTEERPTGGRSERPPYRPKTGDRPFARKPYGSQRTESRAPRERSEGRPPGERPQRPYAPKTGDRPYARKPYDAQRGEGRPSRERSESRAPRGRTEGRPPVERTERPSFRPRTGDRPFTRKPYEGQRTEGRPSRERSAGRPPRARAEERPQPLEEDFTPASPVETGRPELEADHLDQPSATPIRRIDDDGEPRIRITFEHTHTERIRAVWIYDNMVSEIGGPVINGHAVSVFDQRNRFLGSAIYNENSRIRARMFSLDKQDFSQPYVFGALEAAISRRRVLFPPEDSHRLVFSESDFLPGLIVDKIGDVLAVQLLTLAIDRHAEAIVSHLQELLHPSGIIAHRDMQIREKEGLPLVPPLVRGIVPPTARVEQDDLAAYANIRTGQKTGLYLDQRFNRRRIIPWSQDARVLDLFCYNGVWSLTAARAGASEVTAVDSSEPALELARRGAVTNGFSQINFVQSDVFDFLDAHDEKKQYDVIVCDPPAFAKTAKQADQATRGYLSLNYRCMKLLRPGGVLVTSSCSHYVGSDEFETTLETAARNARMQFQILERCPQPPDHPVLLGFPESDYLKCFVMLRTE